MELSHSKNYSEKTAQIIDEEVRRILAEAHQKCHDLMTENLDDLKLLAEALIEFETLDAPDIELLLRDGLNAVRESFKKQKAEAKERVAKVAFTSKIARIAHQSSSEENASSESTDPLDTLKASSEKTVDLSKRPLDPKELPPIELGQDSSPNHDEEK
jgi:cell division protease FtsH